MSLSNNSRQAAWVGIGQFCAYAVGVVSPMILSRYFDKGDYGTYKQVMYVYNTMTMVFSFGLPRAYSYFIPRVSLGESQDVIRKITDIFLAIGALFSLILFFGSSFLAGLLNNPNLSLAFKWFAPAPLFLLPAYGLDCIMASYKKTQIAALYFILTKLFTLVCIVLPVILFSGTYIDAIIGFDIASFITFLLAFYLRNIPTRGIAMERTAVTIKEILDFSVPLMVASVWIVIFQSANQFFVSRYYGNETFADFSNGFIEFPVVPMIVGSVATVLMPLFSSMIAEKSDQVRNLWMRALSKSVKLTYPITFFSLFFAGLIMACFYGDRYASSGIYFTVKNVESLFAIIPFYPIILSLGKTKQYSNIHLIMALVIVPLEYLVVILGLPAVMIGIVFVVCSIGKVILQFFLVSRLVHLPVSDLIPVRTMFMVIAISLLSAVLPFAVWRCWVTADKFVMLALTSLIYGSCYIMLCHLFHISYKDIAASYISKPRYARLIRLIP